MLAGNGSRQRFMLRLQSFLISITLLAFLNFYFIYA